jgi:hypothetical protein
MRYIFVFLLARQAAFMSKGEAVCMMLVKHAGRPLYSITEEKLELQ